MCHLSFDIFCHLKFCVIWHFLSFEILCHLKFCVIWNFVSLDISCFRNLLRRQLRVERFFLYEHFFANHPSQDFSSINTFLKSSFWRFFSIWILFSGYHFQRSGPTKSTLYTEGIFQICHYDWYLRERIRYQIACFFIKFINGLWLTPPPPSFYKVWWEFFETF